MKTTRYSLSMGLQLHLRSLTFPGMDPLVCLFVCVCGGGGRVRVYVGVRLIVC